MNQEPMLSVIVPVYKTETYLPECVDSILNQTYEDFELILVDDGSPDRCGEICDAYAWKDPRVRVVHKKNGGVSSARNAGIDMARGKYLTFIDSDDTVDSTFFAGAISEIGRSSADLYICGLTMETWQNGSIVGRENYHIEKTVRYSIREMYENCEVSYPLMCICGPCCKLYLRETIVKADLRFDESMSLGEDTCFNMNYFERCETVVFDDTVFYHYRRANANSLFSKLHKDTYEVHTKVYDKMYQNMLLVDCSAEAMERFEMMYIKLLIGCIHAFFREKEQVTHKEKIGIIKKVSRHERIESIEVNSLDAATKLLIGLLKRKKILTVWCLFEIRYHFLYRGRND